MLNSDRESARLLMPVTVLTGFLGAGKTSIVQDTIMCYVNKLNIKILSLLRKMPRGYRVFVIKNEYGDVEIDSQLLSASTTASKDASATSSSSSSSSALGGIKEIINGCLCCILVGRLQDALIEILQNRQLFTRSEGRQGEWIDHVIIESSGSAYPAQLALQLKQLQTTLAEPQQQQTNGASFRVDGIVTVIDCLNFRGYDDGASYSARVQAQYTDLILLNKWELVRSERELDVVIDKLHETNPDTPLVRVSLDTIDPALVFGVESTGAFERALDNGVDDTSPVTQRTCSFTLECRRVKLTRQQLLDALESSILPSDMFYRIKGYYQTASEPRVLINWAFGRGDVLPCPDDMTNVDGKLVLNVIGTDLVDLNSESVRKHVVQRIQRAFSLPSDTIEIRVTNASEHHRHE